MDCWNIGLTEYWDISIFYKTKKAAAAAFLMLLHYSFIRDHFAPLVGWRPFQPVVSVMSIVYLPLAPP